MSIIHKKGDTVRFSWQDRFGVIESIHSQYGDIVASVICQGERTWENIDDLVAL